MTRVSNELLIFVTETEKEKSFCAETENKNCIFEFQLVVLHKETELVKCYFI